MMARCSHSLLYPLVDSQFTASFPRYASGYFLLVARLSKCLHCVVEAPCMRNLGSDSIGTLRSLAMHEIQRDNEVTTR